MITRYKSDSEEEFKARCKVEQWEVPMIEVVLNKKEICSLQAAS
jgi:ATP-dependent DNA helicase RecQ